MGANWMGKAKATLQTLVIAAGLFFTDPTQMGATLVGLAACLVVVLAWISYLVFVSWNMDKLHWGGVPPRTEEGAEHGREEGT